MNRIPIACADFSFPLLPHDLVLDLIVGIGIPAVDVSLLVGNSHLDVGIALSKPSCAGTQLAQKLSGKGLRIADVNFAPGPDFLTLALNHPTLEVRTESTECFRRAVEFAATAGASHMTILPGVHWQEESWETSFARSAEELQWRLNHAAEYRISVSVEPHLGSVVSTPQKVMRLLAAVPGLTLTLDYTHFVCQGYSDQECEVLLPNASHFHARGGAEHHLQTSIKNNTIDYGRVLQRMKDLRYPGYFAIEYVWIEWEGCNETDNISETILLKHLADRYR